MGGYLDAMLREAMEEHRVPGAVLAVARGDEEQLACVGVTSIQAPVPVDVGTLFQLGSVTKTVTALAAMRLVERGDLALHRPVRDLIPHFRVADEDASARVAPMHLLTHIAGWEGNFFADGGRGDDAMARYVEQMVDLPQRSPLGQTFAYNNAAYCLLGRLIEVAWGGTYEEAVADLVFRPLGMERSFFFPEDAMTRRFAVGHALEGGGPAVVHRWAVPRAHNAAGGITASPRDVLRYARFWWGDGTGPSGERLLSPERLALMMSPLVPAPGGAQGLGWWVAERDGLGIISHDGATWAQAALLLVAPHRRLAVLALANAREGYAMNESLVWRVWERELAAG